MARLVPARGPAGNKWSAAVLVVAGSPGMTGAAALCARAAYRAGAGMVRLGVPGGDLADVAGHRGGGRGAARRGMGRRPPSRPPPAARPWWSARASGATPATAAEVRRLVAESPVPVVVDADGLYRPRPGGRRTARCQARLPVVLTPHDGEYARLTGGDPGADRIAAARRLAAAAGCGGPAEGADHRGGRSRRPGPAGHWPGPPPWPPPGPVTSCPASSAPCWPGASTPSRRRPWPPTSTAGPGPGAAAEGLVAGDLPDLVADGAGAAHPAAAPTGPTGAGPTGRRRRRSGGPWLTVGGRPGPTSTSTPCGTTPACWPRLAARPALCAVVKADGYGHGAVAVARAALEGGATWLAVALVEEGVNLREAGIEAPILLLSEPPVEGDGRGGGPPARPHRVHQRRDWRR